MIVTAPFMRMIKLFFKARFSTRRSNKVLLSRHDPSEVTSPPSLIGED